MEAAATAHDLLPAYALNALDERDRRNFEAHLESCERCRDELGSLEDAASALAFDAPPAEPAPELRERLLERAREERAPATVVPLRRYGLPAIAAVAVAAAVALAVWGVSLNGSLNRERDARDAREAALAVLSDPTARYVRIRGEEGVLAVTRDGRAALALARLGKAPSGRTYEAWVIRGKAPQAAGLFAGDDGSATLVALARRVPDGAMIPVAFSASTVRSANTLSSRWPRDAAVDFMADSGALIAGLPGPR